MPPAPLRCLEVDASDAARHGDALPRMFRDELDVLLLRGLYPRAVVDRLARRLEARETSLPWDDQGGIVLVGTPLTPNYTSPEGPALDAYLDVGARFETGLRELFAGEAPFAERAHALLEPMTGGLPLELPRAPDGRPYPHATIRGVPVGSQIIDHFESEFLEKASYRHIVTLIETSDQISYFMPLQEAEQGGELRLYRRSFREDGGDRGRHPDRTSLPYEAFRPGAGDVIVFAGGRHLHGVSKVEGSRRRWTLGGFLAPARSGDRWFWFS